MTNDILLRELERTDLVAINLWRSDYDLVALLGGGFRHIGTEVDANWFDTYLKSRANNVRLAICLAESREIIGVVYLLNIDWINRSADFSIQIGAAHARGRGIGKAATERMLEHAFADLNLRRVTLCVLATNTRAIALYEKAGFQREGLFREAAYKNGMYVDVVSMALLAHDYQ